MVVFECMGLYVVLFDLLCFWFFYERVFGIEFEFIIDVFIGFNLVGGMFVIVLKVVYV